MRNSQRPSLSARLRALPHSGAHWGLPLGIGILVYAVHGAIAEQNARRQELAVHEGLAVARLVRQQVQSRPFAQAFEACQPARTEAPAAARVHCADGAVWVHAEAGHGVPAVTLALVPNHIGDRIVSWRCLDRSSDPSTAVPLVCRP